MPHHNIDFDISGIGKVLQNFWLRVPPNQREYSWTDDEVGELLHDLTNAMRKPGESYFLGTIVLTKSHGEKLEIADGQQRLATTTMILSVIRDLHLANGDNVGVESIENDFLTNIDYDAHERVPKLILNLDDNQFFRNAVIAKPTERVIMNPSRRSHRLILGAKSLITEHFSQTANQVGAANLPSFLADWRRYLHTNATVVLLRVIDGSSAFTMFATLNDRGLKTSQADLVKNHLFEVSGDRLPEAQKHWSSMRGAIETVGEDDLIMEYLRLACCVLYGATTEKEVFTKIESNTRVKSDAIRLLHFLDELSGDYAAILNSDHPKWSDYDPDVRKAIRAIKSLGVTQIRPLMLAVARYFDSAKASRAFNRMVAWSVRFLIVGGRGGKLDEGYARLANEIHKTATKQTLTGATKIESDEDLKNAASTSFVPTDAQFRLAFETARVSVSTLARYYLRALEKTARNEPQPEFIPNDETVINLEHVMPQKYMDGGQYTQQDVETHSRRLGNLALLKQAKNTEAGGGSIPFADKRAIYRESAFVLTNQIAELDKWGIPEIEARQKTLAGLAVKTWPLD